MLRQHLELDAALRRRLDVLGPDAQHVARQRMGRRRPSSTSSGSFAPTRRCAPARAQGEGAASVAKRRHAILRVSDRKSVSFPDVGMRVACSGAADTSYSARLSHDATTSRIPSVGFIGLGVMGGPMAAHLAASRPRACAVRRARGPCDADSRRPSPARRRRPRRPTSRGAATSSSRWCRTAKSCATSSPDRTACSPASGRARCCSTRRRPSRG